MPFELPALPFPKDALHPHMSAETFDYHHGKHHKTYVDKLNAAIAGTPFDGLSLEEVIKKAAAEGNKAVFNNAAQHFNHSFFWNSLSPKGGQPVRRWSARSPRPSAASKRSRPRSPTKRSTTSRAAGAGS
jgi:superoxide dismutase, Fe-Mn family